MGVRMAHCYDVVVLNKKEKKNNVERNGEGGGARKWRAR